MDTPDERYDLRCSFPLSILRRIYSNSSFYSYIRTVEDVTKIIQHAKLNEKTLAPVSQAIYFSDITKQYRLLELDNELLSKLENGVGYVLLLFLTGISFT